MSSQDRKSDWSINIQYIQWIFHSTGTREIEAMCCQ